MFSIKKYNVPTKYLETGCRYDLYKLFRCKLSKVFLAVCTNKFSKKV